MVFVAECDLPADQDLADIALSSEVITHDGVTPVTLMEIRLPAWSVFNVKTRILSVRTAGSGAQGDSWAYELVTKLKNVGGVITVSNPIQTVFGDGDAPSVTFTTSGQNFIIQVVGLASTTIAWRAENSLMCFKY
jgi:hypothetical protein